MQNKPILSDNSRTTRDEVEAKLRAALWNEQAQTGRIGAIEAALSTLAPHAAVARLSEMAADASATASRVSSLEEAVRHIEGERDGSRRWVAARMEQIDAIQDALDRSDLLRDELHVTRS